MVEKKMTTNVETHSKIKNGNEIKHLKHFKISGTWKKIALQLT